MDCIKKNCTGRLRLSRGKYICQECHNVYTVVEVENEDR